MERTRKFFEAKTYTGIPVPTKKQENKDKFGQNTEDKLVEWEKNQVKELFVKHDTDKKGVTKEDLVEILKGLMKDECIIGKVPNLTDDEVSKLFNSNHYRSQPCLIIGTSLRKKSAAGGISVSA